MATFEGVSAQSSSQPKSSGSSRNLQFGIGRPGPSSGFDHYQPFYEDREMAMFHPQPCPWQIKRDEACGKKYATLDHLYRHVLQAHLQPLHGTVATSSRKPFKLFACKWVSGAKACTYAPKTSQDLAKHVEKEHFDVYSAACQYPDCQLYEFKDRRSRNEHHEREHRGKIKANGKQKGTEPEVKKRTRLVPAPMDEERWKRETLEDLLLALPDVSGLGYQPSTKARHPFDPGVEVPFWVECLVPIGRSGKEKPAQAAKAREDSTSSQSSIGHVGHGVRALTARTDQANVPQTVESDTSSSSDDADEEDDDDVSIFIMSSRRRSNPRSTLAFVASRSTPVLPQKKRPDELTRNPGLSLPHVPLTFQVASDPATTGPDGVKRYRRHPLLKVLDEAEEGGEDSGDESDSSVQNNSRWLAGVKSAFVERGLTMELWRKEQRKMRRMLYPEHPDAGLDSDGDDTPRAQAAGARPEYSAAPFRTANGDPTRSNPPVSAPQKHAPTLPESVLSALPDIPRRAESSRLLLPTIPKKAAVPPVPPPVRTQADAARPTSALSSSRTGPPSHPQTKLGQSPQSIPTRPVLNPASDVRTIPASSGSHEGSKNNRSWDDTASMRQKPVAMDEDRAVPCHTGKVSNQQPAPSNGLPKPSSRSPNISGSIKADPHGKIFDHIGDLLVQNEQENTTRKRVVAEKQALREKGKSADDAIAISSGSEAEDDGSRSAKKPRIAQSKAEPRELVAESGPRRKGTVIGGDSKRATSPVRPSPALEKIKEVVDATSSANLASGGADADVWKKLQRVANFAGRIPSSRQWQDPHDSDEMDELEDSQASRSDRRLSPSRSPQISQSLPVQMNTPSRSNSVASSVQQQPEAADSAIPPIPRIRDVKMAAATRTPDRSASTRPEPMIIDLTMDDSD
ncbi:hypothetical protein OC846_002884 [Tilletia horrida]|uniref:Uncharacterized protein n=1 Tax=Tilletia horrida TaxID=155126 RepID=A0AAN6JS88_9BASI|nr:hypothetical protein OC845_002079 [Tilletia horrida]KAK0552480.1 hypothetical protein OC846_002884 [Tilletia horrida]